MLTNHNDGKLDNRNQPDPDVECRFFKKFFEPPQFNKKIDAVKFGVFSERDIHQLSATQITSSKLYDEDTLEPNPSGPCDLRLGSSIPRTLCGTCGLNKDECIGHFGHIDLVLPCFHIGYIKDCIIILRMICKSCSRVLLSPNATKEVDDPDFWKKRMSARMLSRTAYQKYLKKVVEICTKKKQKACEYCGAINGTIKKHNKTFRILHEKYTKGRTNASDNNNRSYRTNASVYSDITANYLELYDNIVDYELLQKPHKIRDFERNISTYAIYEDLMPWDVRLLFENILKEDYVLIGLRFSNYHSPEDLILTKLVVPPNILRPGTRLDGDRTNEDDLTIQLTKIIEINNQIKKKMDKGGGIDIIIESFFLLNKRISEYFISDLPGYPTSNMKPKSMGIGRRKSTTLAGTRSSILKGKKIRSFSDRLKGKFGRFRGNLSGKRVNFSGRTVISPDPNLKLNELGVPIEICKLLTFTSIVTKWNKAFMTKLILNGPHKYPGASQVYTRPRANDNRLLTDKYRWFSLTKSSIRSKVGKYWLRYGDKVERHLINGDVVLFNRQPSLHRVSIMSHNVRAVPYKTFRFNPCCCNPYNADFDGDEMNIHAPQTLLSKSEALILMNVIYNFSAPKDSAPLIVPIQDIITSTYLLTLKRMFFNKQELMQLIGFMDNCCISSSYLLPHPSILKPIKLWTGKQVFSMILKPTNSDVIDNWPIINLETRARNYHGSSSPLLNDCLDPYDGYVIIRNSELLCGNIDKNILGSSSCGLFFRLIADFTPQHTALCMNRLTSLSTRFIQNYGFSIGIDDVSGSDLLRKEINSLISSGCDESKKFISSYNNLTLQPHPGCSLLKTLESLLNQRLSQIREDCGKKCINYLNYYYNAPLIMAICGGKGSRINISQMVALVGQQTVGGSRVQNQFNNRTLPHFKLNDLSASAKGFVSNSFFSGITSTEFFFHTMGGREGLVDTAVKTAETGYMQRRLMKNIEDLSIQYDYTVRNCKKQIIQFVFGHDAIDPMLCEDDKNVINFKQILVNIRNQRHLISKQQNHVQNVLSPKNMLKKSKKYIFKFINKKLLFLRRNITYLNDNCRYKFENSLLLFIRNSIYIPANKYHCNMVDLSENIILNKWYCELYGYTLLELKLLIRNSTNRYISCIMEPGSAVGGVSATSLGEPATQMTLKTFHFAGVASMNITQGVPRITEIMNATPNIKTPIMTAKFIKNDSEIIAKIIKSRIDVTKLGEICIFIQQVTRKHKVYLECKLNLTAISALYLQLTNRDIAEIISLNIKKILPKSARNKINISDIRIATKNNNLIRIQPLCKNNSTTNSSKILAIILNHLMVNIQNIIIRGLPTVNRAIIKKNTIKYGEFDKNDLKLLKKGSLLFYREKEVRVQNIDIKNELINNIPAIYFKQYTYELLVEGKGCYFDVLNISGIKASDTLSNDIIEVSRILGIEAATASIISELLTVYSSHGLNIDIRHLMLIADLMTYTGTVLGFTRHGMMGKEDKSILTMASYEETVKHLFQAALHGETTKINGVSDSIIIGTPIPIGTGSCSVLRDVDHDHHHNHNTNFLLGKSDLKEMTTN